MSGAMINSTRIEALTKENYDTWRMQVEALMIKNDLWEYVTGQNAAPVLRDGADETTQSAYLTKFQKWKKNDMKARSDLILSIHPSELPQVRNLETSREIWQKLESVFASKGPARKATYFKQLFLTRMSEGGDVREHMKKFFDAVDKLAAMEENVSPDLLSIMLLYSLPPSYGDFRVAIESRDKIPDAEALKVKILEEYDVREQNNADGVVGALATRMKSCSKRFNNQSKRVGKSDKQKDGVVCYHCKKPGHIRPTCPERNAGSSLDKDRRKQSRGQSEKGRSDKNDTYLACHGTWRNVFLERSRQVIRNDADEGQVLAKVVELLSRDEDADHVSFHSVFEEVHQATGSGNVISSDKWILDSGCTAHVCGDEEYFDWIDRTIGGRLNLASNDSSQVKGRGTVRLPVASDQGRKVIELRNTLFVPDLRANLISVARITDSGHAVVFTNNSAKVMEPSGKIKLKAGRQGDLYYMQVDEDEETEVSHLAQPSMDVKLWHERMGHLNMKDLSKLLQKVTGNVVKSVDNGTCEVCLKGKMVATPFAKGDGPCSELLRVVHSDVAGPFRVRALNGARYYVSFIDDCSRMCQVYFLKEKSGVLDAFKIFHKSAENQTGHRIKILQTDGGKEFCNRAMDDYLQSFGIERRVTVPRTPEQNGVAERMNRTLMDSARCLLIQSNMSSHFWADAVATASYLRNRSPSSSIKGNIPLEIWTGKLPDLGNIRTFGSKVHVLNKDPSKDKLASRSKEGFFIGYPRETKGYRVWLPNERKSIVTRDIKFLKSTESAAEVNEEQDPFEPEPGELPVAQDDPSLEHACGRQSSSRGSSTNNSSQSSGGTEIRNPSNRGQARRGRGRPSLLRTGSRGRPVKVYCQSRRSTVVDESEESGIPTIVLDETNDDVFEDANISFSVDDSERTLEDAFVSMCPFSGIAEISIDEAMAGGDRAEWKGAIMEEMRSHIRNDTWKIVKRPEGAKVVGCRLVLTNKYDENGTIKRRKARLVAKGYSQRPGIDYHETYAPVARLETLRLMLALSAELNLRVWQYDVVTAYLNGQIDEEIHMEMPPMLAESLEQLAMQENPKSEITDKIEKMRTNLQGGGNCCLLQKALYGLKQAGRQWNQKISDKLLSMGVQQAKSDPCLFHDEKSGHRLLILIYVDDILLASNDDAWRTRIQNELCKEFQMKDLGLAKYCLGLEIRQDVERITLSQQNHIRNLLAHFGMKDCRPVSTPAVLGNKLIEPVEEKSTDWPYREAIGALIYLVTASRPDIANTVSRLAQFTNNPSKEHWISVKRVFRYLAGTINLGIVYHKSSKPIVAYTDADWANCLVNRKSYSGYCYILAGGVISWKSQKQRVVALSSTEAEYISLAEAVKEGLHQRSLLHEMKLFEFSKIVIFVDNTGAVCISQGQVHHPRTKHIDIRHHFIKDVINKGYVEVQYVPTEQNVADVLTKPLSKDLHWKCIESMGLCRINVDIQK
uniref:POLX_0 protein n=1 Tax=Fopius arisanus TaxID=64838 RepID=A0A0C9QD48_9HYME